MLWKHKENLISYENLNFILINKNIKSFLGENNYYDFDFEPDYKMLGVDKNYFISA